MIISNAYHSFDLSARRNLAQNKVIKAFLYCIEQELDKAILEQPHPTSYTRDAIEKYGYLLANIKNQKGIVQSIRMLLEQEERAMESTSPVTAKLIEEYRNV